MFEAQSVIDGDPAGESPMILSVERCDILCEIGWRRQGLLEISCQSNTHQCVRIFIPGCSTAPTSGSILVHPHELAPVVLLVIEVFIVETRFEGMRANDLREILSNAGNTFQGDH